MEGFNREHTGESIKKSKKKKMKTVEVDEEEVVVKEDNPNAVSKFRIFEPLRNALKAKGIEALFPIQAWTFNLIYDGLHLIGKLKPVRASIGFHFANIGVPNKWT